MIRKPISLFGIMMAMLLVGEPASAMGLGVTTHFGQGYPLRQMDFLRASKAGAIRDTLGWKLVESAPGRYNFDNANAAYINQACAAGKDVMLVIKPRNPLYDGGDTVSSPAGQAAFANYLVAVADRYQNCIVAFEIDNEINNRDGITGTARVDRIASHTALLKAVYSRLKPVHPAIRILGGSTNAIPTGFLTRLFAAGALQWMDGVVVHPYRVEPANTDFEIEALKAAMRAHGGEKPIWATEFGSAFDRDGLAPPFLLKMIAQLSASGVERAYWYSLTDEPAFPTMGLYTFTGSEEPAAAAFSYAATELVARGRAVRLNPGDRTVFLYRFGSDRYLLWGNARAFSVTGDARFRDARGHLIARPSQIGADPIIIEGDVKITLGENPVLADSLFQYGGAPWSYFSRPTGKAPVSLELVHWNWTSYLGTRVPPRVTVTPLGMLPGGTAAKGADVVLQFKASSTEPVVAYMCFSRKTKSDGVTFTLLHNGQQKLRQLVVGREMALQIPLSLRSGDVVDFVTSPYGTRAGDNTLYRYRILRADAPPPAC